MAVVAASAPSTSAFTPAERIESSNQENERADTFSDLMAEVNGTLVGEIFAMVWETSSANPTVAYETNVAMIYYLLKMRKLK
jgi:hypothetical protein